MSSSLFTPLKFTGISKYSTDFQTIIDRAVSIASLPLKMAQNQQADLLQKKQALSDLGASVTGIAGKLTALGTLGGNRGITATSSNSDKVAILSANASLPAVYDITDVTSLAKAASETSLNGYAGSGSTPVSASGRVALVFGPPGKETTTTIDLDPASNNLIGLRDKINSLNLGVNASILTTGTGGDANYLSLSANASGANTLRLVEDPDGTATDMLTSANQGADTVFKLNGITVRKSGAVINDVVPGISFNVLAKTDPGESVTLTLASNAGAISQALQDLAAGYNATVDKLNAQIGQNAGLLSGDNIIREIQQGLRSIGTYAGSGSGSIRSLAALGIEFGKDGKMTFNASTFNALSPASLNDAFTFLGSATTGFGALAGRFTAISDPVNGMIRLQQNQYDATDRRLNTQVSDLATRITNMQTALAAKLEAADQLLAALDSQQSLLSASIDSLNFSLYGKRDANS